MAATESQPLFRQNKRGSERTNAREDALRLVEYAPYPRVSLDQGPQVGLALNRSESGLCIAVNEPEELGTLLRLVVRGVDGRPVQDVLARVVWCRAADDGRHRLGIALLREQRPKPMRVRYGEDRRGAAVGAS
jgi:hypothetical protein